MRKPTDSSGIDNLTATCRSLNRNLNQIEVWAQFGDGNDEDEVLKDDYIS